MKAANKNTMREIAKSRNRFLSIFFICAIGVGFFSGVRATCNDMKISADDYYDANNLFDFRVLSTFGLTEGDAEALAEELPEDYSVFPSKYVDLEIHKGDDGYLTRVYSQQTDEINKIDLFEGREIENDGECLISYSHFTGGINLGDKVSLNDLAEADEFPLKHKEYTVVGFYRTPMYISVTQRGSTNIGDGKIDAFMIVPIGDFTQDVFTEIYIRSRETMAQMKCYSDEYKDHREGVTDTLKALGEKRSVIRYDEVIGDALREIEDGEKELADAKIDGQKELDDAKKKLDDGEKEIKDGEKELADAKAELDDGAVKIADAERELADAKAELDDGKKQLAEGKTTLDDSKKELDEAQAEIDKQRESLEAGKTQLAAGKAEYEAGLAQYNAAAGQLAVQEQQLAAAEQMYGAAAVAAQRTELEAGKAVLAQTKAQLDAALAGITENEAVLAAGEAQLNDAQKQLDEGKAQYDEGLAEYEENAKKLADGEREYNEGLAEFIEKKADYEQGLIDYEDGVKALEDAKAELADGYVEYNDGVAEYNTKIADAEKELADAREKISDAGNAEWYVFTRDDNTGYSEYGDNAERINKIAAIFPIFFLLVAGLVCLTTMSRMVEEQRTQIGTLKALGYSNGAIMRHYMVYAVSGAFVGGTLGAIGGCFLFPYIIVYAYSIMYNITSVHYLFEPDNMILSIGSMVLAIALTVFFSCKKALEETPASLMRPKAPKAGKRVLIEKIPFLWNNLSFFAKVSGRNLFRYKRRMFMTIIGIAGCTALSLTGFGLKDSISDIVELQYFDIYKYSGYLAYDEDAKPSEAESVIDDLKSFNPDTEYMRALMKQYKLQKGGNSAQVYITCSQDPEIFTDFIDLHERVSREPLTLANGAIITEKAAKLLGAVQGDEISIQISDGVLKTVRIAGITEHYSAHFLYLGEDLYKETFGEAPKYNIVFFNNGISEQGDASDAFSAHMLKNDKVLAVVMNAASVNSVREVLNMLDVITIVLIVSAGALAFVVLYNLTNVNITERIREIATLKVLGFYDMEVSSYVFRENIILSMMGGAVGLGLGYALCMFVITTAEIDEMMFGRSIHLPSYLWAFLVTVAFSLIVNIMMSRVLKKISMVESLKSVE